MAYYYRRMWRNEQHASKTRSIYLYHMPRSKRKWLSRRLSDRNFLNRNVLGRNWPSIRNWPSSRRRHARDLLPSNLLIIRFILINSPANCTTPATIMTIVLAAATRKKCSRDYLTVITTNNSKIMTWIPIWNFPILN